MGLYGCDGSQIVMGWGCFVANHGKPRQTMANRGRFWKRATPVRSPIPMITDPRHRELLQRAIDAQTVVADELQSAYNARIALPIDHPQRLETQDLWRDGKALEDLISGAHGLLTGNAGAVALQGRSQP